MRGSLSACARQLTRRWAGAALCAAFAACPLVAGCSVFSASGPSHVARGEYYSAGKPEFDSFFIALHDKQVELLAAPVEPREARRNLTRSLGLTADASDDALKSRLNAELQKLASQGLRVRLEVPPPAASVDASAVLHTSQTTTPTPFRELLPTEASRLVRSRGAMLSACAELDKLNVIGVTLDSKVDAAFRVEGPWKRDEVRRNLADGQKLVLLMKARAQETIAFDERLLALLGAVVNTDPGLGQASAVLPEPVEEAPRSPRNRAAPSSSRGRGGSGSVAPAPAPRRGDEEGRAAPKPTQGSAPAEIEP